MAMSMIGTKTFGEKPKPFQIEEGGEYYYVGSEAFAKGGLSPGHYNIKYSEKLDKNRELRRVKMRQPDVKRRRLILKQERATKKGAYEASEGSSYQSEVGLAENQDIEAIPEAVPKPTFNAVSKLKNMSPTYIVFDLETTGLIRQGIMPHITQIAAVEMHSGNQFTCYVLPKVPIEASAEKVTGIVFDGTDLFVNGQKVDALTISDAIGKLLEWLGQFNTVVLVAHNGRVFDFRVISHAVMLLGKHDEFIDKIDGLVDSLSMIRSCHKNLKSYKQECLALHFCGETYDAHDALEDVKMLSKILKCAVTNVDFVKASYDTHNHLLQENFNSAKSQNLSSLHVLVGAGIVKIGMAENIAGSGLNLHSLRVIHARAGEDGLRNTFCSKNSIGKPRVTSDNKVLDAVIPKMSQFLSA
ncbi:hypothetical protein FSP39_012417 [Pinctada imbricata]|uniref:Exonuclease domain-containing protein n=1 Tax=Pinctada imbricata TaxID=66713 RepID=A0AA88XFE8_PINIB|nr:hypothetical protein FSP39_012417 [Pinctada imbricata]